jgi:hypothetical protein
MTVQELFFSYVAGGFYTPWTGGNFTGSTDMVSAAPGDPADEVRPLTSSPPS